MKTRTTLLAAVAAGFLAHGAAIGAVTAEEAKALGTTLTPWGAEVAGNKDGTIPAYTGGVKPPASFQPGSGVYPDPYKDDKPLFTITAQNLAQYADKLSEGQKTLFARYPDFKMDIYPTRRSFALPEAVADATIRNATTARTAGDGIGLADASGGLPFPIPKTGFEVMWNRLLNYQTEVVQFMTTGAYIDQNGRRILTAYTNNRFEYPYYQADNKERSSVYVKMNALAAEPAALAGQIFRTVDPLDFMSADRKAWQYIPGQRRVKVAPELAYDAPYPGGPGLTTMDDIFMFSGKMDRYDFKLVGKKEMYIPYNLYKLYDMLLSSNSSRALETLGTPKFPNPDLIRWELHRVWVVEGELLPGKRHIYKKRVFYFDEDGYSAGMNDRYDSSGKLLRMGYVLPIQLYDRGAMLSTAWIDFDFSANVYIPSGMPNGTKIRAGLTGPGAATAWSTREWSPEGMGAGGAR